jgi:hypothetical protein
MPISTVSQKGLDAPLTLTSPVLNSPTLTSPVTSGTPTGVGVLTSDTAKASTSGTSIDFTSIPSWVKRITINFYNVSTNGSSDKLIQLGDSGGVETTGYLGSSSAISSAVASTLYTTGFGIRSGGAGEINHGSIVVSLLDSATNTWAAFGVTSRSDGAQTFTTAGSKQLSATLDRVRITAVNGTDAFDLGLINILYE